MKTLVLACLGILFSAHLYAQKSTCTIPVVTDSFTGKKKLYSKNLPILEKLYLTEMNLDIAPWKMTIGFWKEDALLLCVKHLTEGIRQTSFVDVLDIKFEDGTVFSLNAPIEGTLTKFKAFKEDTNLSTFFKLSKEQLLKLSTSLIVKTRVKFRDNPNDQIVEKDLNKLKAEKIKAEANCFKETLSTM